MSIQSLSDTAEVSLAGSDEETSGTNSHGKSTGRSGEQRWIYFWGALLLMPIPMMVPYLLSAWQHEHYQYIPGVFLLVLYLAYTRFDGRFYPPTGALTWIFIGVGTASIVASLLIPSAWMAGVAFVFLAAACLRSCRGENGEGSLFALALPLVMLVQLPIGLDTMLINRLQRITTQLASVALDICGVPHSLSGNILQLADRQLFVAEACSGIQSVFTLAFLSLAIVAWRRRRLWLTPLYLMLAIGLAVAGNTLRVSIVALAHHFIELDLAEGWAHDVLGYCTLCLAIFFLMSADHLLIAVFHPLPSESDTSGQNPLIQIYNFFFGENKKVELSEFRTNAAGDTDSFFYRLNGLITSRTGLVVSGCLIAIILIGSVVQASRVEVNRAPEALVRSVVLFEPDKSLLDSQFESIDIISHEMTRNGSEPRLGQNADLWEFQTDGLRGQIVLSQTYSGWHELCVCYQNMSWNLLDRDVTEPIEIIDSPTDQSTDDETFITARFKRNDNLYGYLFFTAVNQDGSIPDAPSNLGAFGARFFSRLERYGAIQQQDLVMLQMWISSPERIRESRLNALRRDFVKARSAVSDALVKVPMALTPNVESDVNLQLVSTPN